MALNLLDRMFNYIHPFILIILAFYGAVIVTLQTIISNPSELLNIGRLRDKAFGKFWLLYNTHFDKGEELTPLPSLLSTATGTILEIGPGSGTQLPRYDRTQITKIYGIEPNRSLHPALRAAIRDAGLEGKYEIVGCGIEDGEGLRKAGVVAGEVDTVVCVNVLCGVPGPEGVCRGIHGVLRPGGRLVVFEHVGSGDWVSRRVQDLYNIIWPYFLGNCNLTRPTKRYLLEAGEWSKVELEAPKPEDAALFFPRVVGTLTKRRM